MDKTGEESNRNFIRIPYSAPEIIIEFELEASAGTASCVGPTCVGGNNYNPWELP